MSEHPPQAERSSTRMCRVYRIYRREKEQLPTQLMVRFEGVAGEFAQFDFGQADVRLLDDFDFDQSTGA